MYAERPTVMIRLKQFREILQRGCQYGAEHKLESSGLTDTDSHFSGIVSIEIWNMYLKDLRT